MRKLLDSVFKLFSKLSRGKFDNYFVHRYADQLSFEISESLGHRVIFGPFKGMKLNPNSYLSKYILANFALGSYENKVQKELENFSKKYQYDVFIDIGGADGLFAIGVLVNNMFKKTIVFELEKRGQRAILENAKLNSVSDKIEINGIADSNSLSKVISNNPNSVLLMDIEGAEFDIFNKNLLLKMSKMPFIIEIHCFKQDDQKKYKKLKELIKLTHDFKVLNNDKQELSSHVHLKDFTDMQKALVLTERRTIRAEWLVCETKASK